MTAAEGELRRSGDPLPLVAVCIPARQPGATLERVLSAVNDDDWPADRREVIVALDGPDASLADTARALGARVVTLERPAGSYAARNLAIDSLSSRVEYVIFTDADCVPQPGWIGAHVSALQRADLTGGAIEIVKRDRPGIAEFIDSIRHLDQEGYVTRQGWAATANLGLRRAIAKRKFRADLVSGGDREFCLAAVAAGCRLAYAPQAMVHHPARRTMRELFRKVRRVALGIESFPEAAWMPSPSLRPPKWVAFRARRDGVSRGRSWEVRAVLVNWAANVVVARSIHRVRKRTAK